MISQTTTSEIDWYQIPKYASSRSCLKEITNTYFIGQVSLKNVFLNQSLLLEGLHIIISVIILIVSYPSDVRDHGLPFYR